MIGVAAAVAGQGWKIVAVAGAALVLIGAGVSAGIWLAAGHYRPLLDTAGTELAACRASSSALQGQVDEQNGKVQALAQQAAQRQATAEQAAAHARLDAQVDYAAANRLQQERTGGDQCRAAESIIDQELGL